MIIMVSRVRALQKRVELANSIMSVCVCVCVCVCVYYRVMYYIKNKNPNDLAQPSVIV